MSRSTHKFASRLCVVSAMVMGAWSAQVWAGTLTRTSAFDYGTSGTAAGLLIKEMVEPGSPDLCVVTEYTYDNFGNRKTANTRNCNGSAGATTGAMTEASAPAASTDSAPTGAFTARSSSTDYGTTGQFPLTITNALSQSETRTYDPRFGAVTSVTGPNLLTTKWAYDEFGRKVLEQRADDTGTRWKYEYCSSVTVNGTAGSASCPTIASATGAYVLTVYPVKSATITVNADGSSTDGGDGGANGPYTKTYYDTINRPIRSVTQGFDGNKDGTINATPPLIYQDTEYNALGQVSRRSLPYFSDATDIKWISYTYDTLGRVVKTTTPDAGETKTTYAGLTITVTNPKGKTRKETRNVAGQLVTIEDEATKTLTKTYDAFGNMLTTSDSAGNVTTLVYDIKGRKTQMIDPDMGTWDYKYDALGQLVWQRDALLQVANMTYDVLGRLTYKGEPTQKANWYYEKSKDGTTTCGAGRLCEVASDKSYGRVHAYDSLGRPTSTTTTVNNTSYTSSTSYVTDKTSQDYGRIKDFTYPSTSIQKLTLAYVYTTLGFTQKLVSATNSNTVFWRQESVDAQGHQLQYSYGNGLTTNNEFYADTGLLKGTKVGTNGVVQTSSYQYDSLGNLTSQSDSIAGQNATYTYDDLNRLKTETRWGTGITQVNAQTITWNYDNIGNITSRSDVGTYSYPTGTNPVRPHAVSSVTGTVNRITNPSYGYNANGNITDSAGRSVTWTSFNKIDTISTKNNTVSVSYGYDAEGERVRSTLSKNNTLQTTTIYLNPGAGAGLYYEEEIPASGTKKQKYYLSAGGGTIGVLTLTGSTWTTQYWHKDHLGSTVAITNEVGTVVERMAYEPFGKRRNVDETTDSLGTLASVNTKRGYTGHEMIDELGLINMNGRVYDPAISRFLSPDPYITHTRDMQSFNRYAYVRNNPLKSFDPSGYTSCTLQDGVDLMNGTGGGCGSGGQQTSTVATGNNQAICSAKGHCGVTQDCSAKRGDCMVKFCAQSNSVQGCYSWAFDSVPYNSGKKTNQPGNPNPNTSSNPDPANNKSENKNDKGQLNAWGPSNALTYVRSMVTVFGAIPVLNVPAGVINIGLDWYSGDNITLSVLMLIPIANEEAVVLKELKLAESLTVDAAKKASAYTVAFETTIAKAGVGTRASHFADANASLLSAMKSDASFAQMMDDLGVSVGRMDRSPANWTWHHVADQPGVMQLVPRAEHQAGSFQSLLHPDGVGGFKLWGADY